MADVRASRLGRSQLGRSSQLSETFINKRWSLNSSDRSLSIPRQRRRQSIRQSVMRKVASDEEAGKGEGLGEPVVAYNDLSKIFSVLLGQDFRFVQQAVKDFYCQHSDDVEEMNRERFHKLVEALLACPNVNAGVGTMAGAVDQKAQKQEMFSAGKGVQDSFISDVLRDSGSSFSSKYWRYVIAHLDYLSFLWTQSGFQSLLYCGGR